MQDPLRGIVIWAHSKCRSTFGLYREVMRQAGVPVRIVLWKGALEKRVAQGFAEDEFADVPCEVVGEDWEKARWVLDETAGWVQVVCAYQIWELGQRVMRVAHARGDRVVVYSEAPCEMSVGVKAWAKRMYYRWVLPWKMRGVVRCADMILSQSGTMGMDRLMRLGWRREQIVPFGYATEGLVREKNVEEKNKLTGALRVLHLGIEEKYRGVEVLEKVRSKKEEGRSGGEGRREKEKVKSKKEEGRSDGEGRMKKEKGRREREGRSKGEEGGSFEVRRTGGEMPLEGVVAAIAWADVVVGCGLCEPWGMRINDAVMAGKPVIVSDGMGVAWMVEQTGCGLVVPKGDAGALARALARCAEDRAFLARLKLGAARAAEVWSPRERARRFLALLTEKTQLNQTPPAETNRYAKLCFSATLCLNNHEDEKLNC